MSTMSISSLSSSTMNGWSSKTKQSSMHGFIRSVREYRKNRADETIAIINRHLQLLGVAIDTSIFDPNTSVVCEFFVSMFELLSFIEPRSSLAWGCVSVLQTACKNQAARNQLIHTYQFIPLLARLLGDHLPLEKKIRLLTVIQELSCGVKISWIIPNLEHLMSTLLRWVQNEKENEQVVLLSLGIIVNLCFKNLPGTYMLSKCVDIKQFSKFVLALKGVNLEACACKLFIILDYLHGVVPNETYIKLLKVTFRSVKESFIAKDPILLRQSIDFYLDVKVEGHNIGEVIAEKLDDYAVWIADILHTISEDPGRDPNGRASGDCPMFDPECMTLMFKFLKSIVDFHLPRVDCYYEKLTKTALNWIQTETVASDALSLIRSIVHSTRGQSNTTTSVLMETILASMPIMILNLQQIDKDTIMTIDQCMRLCNIMELLKTLVSTEKTRERVMVYLTKEELQKVFQLATIGNNIVTSSHQAERANDANNFTPEAFALYINTLSLVSVIAKHHIEWQAFLSVIFKSQQMHAILAESLYGGNSEVRTVVLEIIAGNSHVPCEAIAGSMGDLCKNTTHTLASSAKQMDNNMMSYTMISSHSTAPDEAIKILNEARSAQRINISTCDVMELYEYKLATMGHAERAAMASVEAASARCTHLQHQVAQLTAELSRIRQLFLHTQQVQKESENKIKALESANKELRVEKTARIKQLQDEVEGLQEDAAKKAKYIDSLEKERENTRNKIIPQLEESLLRLERVKEHKDDTIKGLQREMQATKQRLGETDLLLKSTEDELQKRSRELEDALKESEERKNLIESIMKLAHSQKAK